MVTFNLGVYALKAKTGIVAARTGLSPQTSTSIVRLVHNLQQSAAGPSAPNRSMRAAILIARVVAMRLNTATLSDALLSQITSDVLNGRGLVVSAGQIAKHLAAQT